MNIFESFSETLRERDVVVCKINYKVVAEIFIRNMVPTVGISEVIKNFDFEDIDEFIDDESKKLREYISCKFLEADEKDRKMMIEFFLDKKEKEFKRRDADEYLIDLNLLIESVNDSSINELQQLNMNTTRYNQDVCASLGIVMTLFLSVFRFGICRVFFRAKTVQQVFDEFYRISHIYNEVYEDILEMPESIDAERYNKIAFRRMLKANSSEEVMTKVLKYSENASQEFFEQFATAIRERASTKPWWTKEDDAIFENLKKTLTNFIIQKKVSFDDFNRMFVLFWIQTKELEKYLPQNKNSEISVNSKVPENSGSSKQLEISEDLEKVDIQEILYTLKTSEKKFKRNVKEEIDVFSELQEKDRKIAELLAENQRLRQKNANFSQIITEKNQKLKAISSSYKPKMPNPSSYVESSEFKPTLKIRLNDEALNYLSEKKVFIVGGSENIHKFLNDKFPDWEFISIKKMGMLKTYNFSNVNLVVFMTKCLSHKCYEFVKGKCIGNVDMLNFNQNNIELLLNEIYKYFIK